MQDRIKGLWLAIIFSAAMSGLTLPPVAAAEKEGSFTGTWNASGKWHPLDFEKGREVFTFRLGGHISLKNDLGNIKNFWAECIGLWDSGTGSTARCVWSMPGGKDAAYLVLHGQIVKEDVRVNGEFVGGAGALEGLTGKVSFTWWSAFRDRTDHILTGYSKDLQGSFQIPKAAD